MYYAKGQKYFNDCGVAVTATILGLYGIDYNYKSLGKINDFLDIMVVLQKYNIFSKAFESKDIKTFPCIIQTRCFNRYHFMVIYEEINNYYTYFSPNKIFVHRIKKDKLLKIFTNKIIYIEDKRKYCNYKFKLSYIPYSIKLIIFDVITLILIYNILTSML